MSLLIGRTDDIEACRDLRRAVFIEEQNVPEALEWDGRDGDALHILTRQDGQPVGCLRMFLNPPVAKVGRVCVLPPLRGTGLGRKMMEAAIAIARDESGVEEVKLGAQLHVIEFYRRLGFEPHGPIYDDAGIPHRDMTLPLRDAH